MAERFIVLLVEGKPSPDHPLTVIQMKPDPELGGAYASVGPSIELPWEKLRSDGVEALVKLVRAAGVGEGGEPNLDLAPRRGRLAGRRVVSVELAATQVIVSRFKGKGTVGEKDRCRLSRPVSPAEFEESVRRMMFGIRGK